LVNKNLLSYLLKDGKEVNAVMLVGRLAAHKVPNAKENAELSVKSQALTVTNWPLHSRL